MLCDHIKACVRDEKRSWAVNERRPKINVTKNAPNLIFISLSSVPRTLIWKLPMKFHRIEKAHNIIALAR